MRFDRKLTQSKPPAFHRCRTAASREPRLPQITIRGDNNLITLGTTGVVTVGSAKGESRLPVPPNSQWPQQILNGIRLKASKSRLSNEQICELAGRILGRAVVTLDRLSARDLARVYEALGAGE